MMRKEIFKNKGMTLIEMMVSVAIFLVISAGLYFVLSTGQATWFNTDASIELQQNLRLTLEKITRELHESGFDEDSISQVGIGNGTGVNGTDILRFSIPVLCESGMNVIDSNGDVAYWGAPLTWGCTDSTCMDADDDCTTVDYKYVEYLLNNSDQLVRRVLNEGFAIVREDIFTNNIVNFQVSSNIDGTLITLQVTAQKLSVINRIISAAANMDVYLRNPG